MSFLTYTFFLVAFTADIVKPYPTGPLPSSSPDINSPDYGPIPGQNPYYSDYRGTAPPFPANNTSPILPISHDKPGPDDVLFQNLLSAEWVIYSFYQQGAELFRQENFTAAGFPNNTYDRLLEIRDNEAGHLRIFQDSISNNSIKPGTCKYDFGFGSDTQAYLALGTEIEISSMAFLTGLVLQAQTNVSKGALMAIGQTETRHEVWHLMDIWNTDPFAGPSDTAFPYANEILDFTNVFVIPGSCPSENPIYPYPRQNLPQLGYDANTTTLLPGSDITITYEDASHVPDFVKGKDYYAVFYHGVDVISVPFDVESNKTVIPGEFESRGVIIVVIADEQDAPTIDSVVAGPLFIFEQPVEINDLVE